MDKLGIEIPSKAIEGLPSDWRQKLSKRMKRPSQEACSDEEFVMLVYQHGGSAYAVAKVLGMSQQMAARRRNKIQEFLGVQFPQSRPETWITQSHRTRITLENVENATFLVGSDAHVWPEHETTAMKAFAGINQLLKPDYVILNGDGLDGAKISRHSRIGWDARPSTKEELEALLDWLDHVRRQNLNGAYIRTQGNHDGRYDTYLSSRAPDMEGVKGMCLDDHLIGWKSCMSILVPDVVMIKHRILGGIHATYRNTLISGISTVTGHLHAQNTTKLTDYRGTRYGVDLGMLAAIQGPQFDYCEDGPRSWRSGGAFLTIERGRLMPPELFEVLDEDAGIFDFRGKRWTA